MPVSVVIPFYNNYHQIQKCIESLFRGTYIPNEVVVVNDGSLKKKNY